MQYTLRDWIKEDSALKAGGDPQPCPRCHRQGFYGPRWAEPNRRYRACKFCGLWQDVDRPPHKIIRYECHGSNHCVADWKEPHESWACPACGAPFTPSAAVLWPVDNPKHCWNDAPAAGTQADYISFWQGKGISPPPFGIP